MPNSIKYNTSTETEALNSGDFWVGVGDVDKGPTQTTGYYNGINPPSGGYTIYVNKASDGPSIKVASDDAELISITNKIAGTSYTTINECFNYFDGQSDKMVTHQMLDFRITDGLVLDLDAGAIPSYPQNGTAWNDLSSGSNDGTLTNGPVWNSGGWFNFDGVDDRISVGNPTSLNFVTDVSCEVVFKRNSNAVTNLRLLSKGGGGASTSQNGFSYFGSNTSIAFACTNNAVRNIQSATITTGKWYHVVGIIDQTSNKIKVYLNGVLTNNATLSGTGTMVGTSDLNIGTFGNSSLPWDGDIENVKIYSIPLTEAEVFQNYYQGSIVTDGLILALDAGNLVSYESGSATSYSLTGSFDANLNNGVGFNSGDGGSWEFDGVDDYISIADSEALRLNGNFTISFFLKAITKANTYPGPVYKGNSGAAGTGYIMFYTSITNGPLYYKRGNVQYALPNAVSTEWSYITFTYDGSNLKGYVNGELGLTSAVSFSTNTDATNLQLGRADQYGNQNIPNFSIYNKALTANEVTQNYNATKSKFI